MFKKAYIAFLSVISVISSFVQISFKQTQIGTDGQIKQFILSSYDSHCMQLMNNVEKYSHFGAIKNNSAFSLNYGAVGAVGAVIRYSY